MMCPYPTDPSMFELRWGCFWLFPMEKWGLWFVWHRPGTPNAFSLCLSLTRAPFFSLCVCVGLLVCMKAGRGLSPTAVVTQLCLVYIRSDNSGSKHRSPYADVPLMAFKHVCGSACLCVKMDCCTCMNLCFSASILHPHSKCFFKHPLILPSCLSVFLRGVCYYVSQWGAKKLLLKHGLLTCHSSLLTAGRVFLLQNMCVCAIRLLLSIFSFSSVSFHSGTSRKSFRNDAANRRQALH